MHGKTVAALAAVAAALTPAGAQAAQGAPGAPGAKANWTRGDKDGVRDLGGDGREGVVHARRRGAERGVRARPGDAEPARPAVRGDGRQDVHRARDRRRDVGDDARGPEEPDLPAGGHGEVRALADHEDVRHRPGALERAGGRDVRVADRAAAAALRAGRPGALEHGRRRQGQRARGVGRQAGERPRRPPGAHAARPTATWARATAGPTCATTTGWTGPTTPRSPATSSSSPRRD